MILKPKNPVKFYFMDINDTTNGQAPQWYILQTALNKENEAFKSVIHLNVEAYLPLHRYHMVLGDKQKWIIKPLFQGIIFVYAQESKLEEIQKISDIKSFIKRTGKPAVIPALYIDFIKNLISTKENFEIRKFNITKGKKIFINEGPLEGHKVNFIKFFGQEKAAINIPIINYSILLDLDSNLFQYASIPELVNFNKN